MAARPVTLYRATIIDTPGDPFAGDPTERWRSTTTARCWSGTAIIAARGPLAAIRRRRTPTSRSTRWRRAAACPASSTPTCTTRRSARSAGSACRCWTGWSSARCRRRPSSPTGPTPRAVAGEFLDGLLALGHDQRAGVRVALRRRHGRAVRRGRAQRGLNITSGLVLSDRILRPDLLTTPERALADSTELIEPLARPRPAAVRRHAAVLAVGVGRDARRLRAAAGQAASGSPRTSTRTWPRSPRSPGLFPAAQHYLDTYRRHGLVTERSVFAHNVHPTDAELAHAGRARRVGRRTARPATARWAAGCSRCAGTSTTASASRWAPTSARGRACSCPRRRCRPTSCSSCSAPDGLSLTPVHLLYLATRAGAQALGLDDRVGDFGIGKDFDAVWLRPADGSPLAVNLAARGQPDRRAGPDLRPRHPGRRGRGLDPGRSGASTGGLGAWPRRPRLSAPASAPVSASGGGGMLAR